MTKKIRAKDEDTTIVAYGLNAQGLKNFENEFKEFASGDDYKVISEIAGRYKLPAGFALYEAIYELRGVRDILAFYPFTGSERAGALDRVVYACQLLDKALFLVRETDADYQKFNSEFREEAQKQDTKIPVDLVRFGSPATVLYRALTVCAKAAISTRESIPNQGKTGGRRPTVSLLSAHIQTLFFVAQPAGMVPARGGDFERFCKEVFEVAGLHGRHEGALRHFIKNQWPDLKKRVNPVGKKTPKTG